MSTEMDSRPLKLPVKPYILVVDDDPQGLRLLSRVIEDAGLPVVGVASAKLAISICKERRPRVVVTDLDMPDLNGLGLARQLTAAHPRLPIVLITGQSLNETELRALGLSFAGVMNKPLDPNEFVQMLGAVGIGGRP
jgi:CheY-like chemotaxis protein